MLFHPGKGLSKLFVYIFFIAPVRQHKHIWIKTSDPPNVLLQDTLSAFRYCAYGLRHYPAWWYHEFLLGAIIYVALKHN